MSVARSLVVPALALALWAPSAWAQKNKPAPDAYVPAPAASIPGYSETVMPCEIIPVDTAPRVSCKGELLEGKSLRELAILRNTIFARYGWAGYRKPWLKEHFFQQPWFKADPKFSYKRLSDADRKNVHFIAVREQSFSERELRWMQNDVYARAGKSWDDVYEWHLKDGRRVKGCDEPEAPLDEAQPCTGLSCRMDESMACHYKVEPWYRPDPKYTDAKLTAEARIELGLLSRALGGYASDSGKLESSQQSLERVLSVNELRQLSLRDLRLLRNTIYARRGRPFKSKVLQAHFAQLGWYKLDPTYTDARLTENDQRNVNLIRSVENEFGGPLKDEDWLIDPATDVA
ncbi:YARHG domain-containing protein [Corallococcus sp. M34]|uniref:YARHG domain-containing protein n=1 Tax=Citreicoccus inhibens TaxID=2849499 RepID=UPI001C2463E1|nr:YARHG domain-containing protein [Citreicoccus inhibens]MBU8894370.1 YARHG domain-containing protein [Citreicoccus inhibens]